MKKISKANYATLLSSFPSMPWKNGGGVSREIAIHPPGSALGKGDFLWRVSSARIEQNGPFSLFPGCKRVLTMLEKELVLRSSQEMVVLREGEIFSFSGEDEFAAEVPRGPAEDLGVIARNTVRVEMTALKFYGKPRSFQLLAETNFFYALSGNYAVSVYPGEIAFDLKPGTVLRVDGLGGGNESERLVLLEPKAADGRIITIELDSSQ